MRSPAEADFEEVEALFAAADERIDARAVAHLTAEHPGLDVRHHDVLTVDWHALAAEDPPRDWAVLRSGHPPVLRFWYRQSPRPLVSLWTSGSVAWRPSTSWRKSTLRLTL